MSTSHQWLVHLKEIMEMGRAVSPKGILTVEVPSKQLMISMADPVLINPQRKLNYKFMLANAFWILSGDNRVETLAPYNKNIAQYSDDGVTFFGAYGPPINDQLDYVVSKLLADPESRQAVLTIWRPNPPETKDMPCTVAMVFDIREGRLNCHVFMRSSDAWLGVPYDLFDFSMVATEVCYRLRQTEAHPTLDLGMLYLTAASSHVYASNFKGVSEVLSEWSMPQPARFWTPEIWGEIGPIEVLRRLKDGGVDDEARWWR